MAFCSNCGAALNEGSSFCASCGKPTNASGQAGSNPQVIAGNRPFVEASGLTPNVAGALSYALGLISGVVFLVLEPYKHDRFVRFHAMQSILFCATAIVVSIGMSIVWGILFSLSASLILIVMPIRLLIALGLFLFWLFVIYQAYNRREFRIPIIGAIAAKQVG